MEVERPPKKNPLLMSDEEIATQTPDELDEVKRVYSNYRDIKSSQREVRVIEQEEMFERRVGEIMQAHGLPRQAAEILAKKEFGIDDSPAPVGFSGGGGIGAQMRDFATAVKAIQEIGTVFSPQGNRPQTASPPAGQTDAFFRAAQLAANKPQPSVLYGPNGQVIEFPGTGSPPQPLLEQVSDVTRTISSLMKASEEMRTTLGAGGGGPTLSPQVAQGMNPELLKVWLEHQARGEEREAQKEIAKMRSESTNNLTSLLLTALQPGGINKLKSIYSSVTGRGGPEGGPAAKIPLGDSTTSAEAPPEGTTFKANCVDCGQQVDVAYGQEAFTCPNCQAECELVW